MIVSPLIIPRQITVSQNEHPVFGQVFGQRQFGASLHTPPVYPLFEHFDSTSLV